MNEKIAILRGRIEELQLLKASSPALIIGFDNIAYCNYRIVKLETEIYLIENPPKPVEPGPLKSIQG